MHFLVLSFGASEVFWHEEWLSEVLEHASHVSDALAFVWDEGGDILGFSCAHDVGFLGYLSVLVVAESARGKGSAVN